jgi:hypothetical protein
VSIPASSDPLGGTLARAVNDAWRPLARHAEACEECAGPVGEVRRGTDNPNPLYERCCPGGRHLFGAWLDAKGELLEQLRSQAAPWGLDGLHVEAREERAAAIMSLPPTAARLIYLTEDAGLREAQLRAVVAAWRRTGAVVAQEPDGLKLCKLPSCGTRFRPPTRFPGKRFCSDQCRHLAKRSGGND